MIEAHGISVLRLVRPRLIGGLFLLVRWTNFEGGTTLDDRWRGVVVVVIRVLLLPFSPTSSGLNLV